MSGQASVGRVVSLRSYPVKSLDAAELSVATVLPSGLEHDRGWAVVDADGAVVTGRQAPGLRDVIAGPPPEPGGAPSVQGDLAEVVGRPVSVQPSAVDGPGSTGARFTEVAPVHVVSRQSVQRAAADEGTTLGDPACSVEEPRANVVLDLDADQLETSWVGRELHVGDVVLRISKQPKHCLGVYADVVRTGSVRVGDDVRLV